MGRAWRHHKPPGKRSEENEAKQRERSETKRTKRNEENEMKRTNPAFTYMWHYVATCEGTPFTKGCKSSGPRKSTWSSAWIPRGRPLKNQRCNLPSPSATFRSLALIVTFRSHALIVTQPCTHRNLPSQPCSRRSRRHHHRPTVPNCKKMYVRSKKPL